MEKKELLLFFLVLALAGCEATSGFRFFLCVFQENEDEERRRRGVCFCAIWRGGGMILLGSLLKKKKGASLLGRGSDLVFFSPCLMLAARLF